MYSRSCEDAASSSNWPGLNHTRESLDRQTEAYIYQPDLPSGEKSWERESEMLIEKEKHLNEPNFEALYCFLVSHFS